MSADRTLYQPAARPCWRDATGALPQRGRRPERVGQALMGFMARSPLSARTPPALPSVSVGSPLMGGGEKTNETHVAVRETNRGRE